MSNVETGGILKQAAHAQRLEEYPEWKEILGIGYSEPQRRVLMYKHLQKLLDLTRTVTGGDATKAKQLVDLLHARARAGENRVQSGMEKAREKNNRMNEGIMLSLSTALSTACTMPAGRAATPTKSVRRCRWWRLASRRPPCSLASQ